MAFEDPTLPFAKDALAPHISKETLEFHFEKHHLGYVKKLRAQIKDTALAGASLEDIIQQSSAGVFNNAAQIWNHSFYWNSLTPNGGGQANGAIKAAIERDFGSLESFQDAFSQAAASNFGSGWTWLVKNSSGKLEILNTNDAETPLTHADLTPILTLDVWEHAYYIDYRNGRGDYIQVFWKLVNWDFANENLGKS